MAKVCDLCGKGYLKGNLVCFSNKKSIKRSYPNLRSVRVVINNVVKRLKVCTSCLGASKRNAKLEAAKVVTSQS